MAAVLEAAGLTKQFGKFTALRSCDLSLPAQKVIGLVGPNGAGKTTLLQVASGLRYPTAGSIRVLGRSPRDDAACANRWACYRVTRSFAATSPRRRTRNRARGCRC